MKLLIISGAGMSAPSGVETFRGPNGIWDEQLIAEVCTESTWRENFAQVHEFYNEKRQLLADLEPNHAHNVIHQIETQLFPGEVVNITQNVDDFFERAGVETLHVHGEITKMECADCGHVWEQGYKPWIKDESCPSCQSVTGVRPFLVFFGGNAPEYEKLHQILQNVTEDTTVLTIGTSNSVLPVDVIIPSLPGKSIRCNLEVGAFDENYDTVILGSIDKTIDQVINLLT